MKGNILKSSVLLSAQVRPELVAVVKSVTSYCYE